MWFRLSQIKCNFKPIENVIYYSYMDLEILIAVV